MERKDNQQGWCVDPRVAVLPLYMLECHIYSLVLFHPYTQVRLVLVCIGAVINFPLAIAVWWKMGSLAFSKVGSNKQLVRKLYTVVATKN